jgi:hypothetical protein
VAVLGAVPAVATMCGIQRIAAAPMAGPRGGQADRLITLRRLLQGLVNAVGALVALSTLALGAAFALQQSLPPSAPFARPAQLAPQTAFIFGGVGSALVAAAYWPASASLRAWARRLCEDLFPLGQADDAATILSQAESRSKLGQVLGVDRSASTDLQAALAVLGPILASAASAFLPR